jgi:MOSC domain-containing protein YiiM
VEDGFDTFARIPVDAVRLIAGHGIEGDAKAGRNPRRQLNLLSCSWLEARAADGFRTEPGAFGEQLVVEGLEVDDLLRGQRLRLGDEAQIAITFPRTGCLRLDAAQPDRADFSGEHIGMLAPVVTGGTIRVGGPITLLPNVSDDPRTEGASSASIT